MEGAGGSGGGASVGTSSTPRSMRRRLVRWTLFLVSGAIGTVLLGTLVRAVSIRRAEAIEKPRHEQRIRRWEAEVRTGKRPVLAPTAEPGNAWDDYEPAFRDCSGITEQDLKVVTAVVEHKGGESELRKASEALAKFRPSLDRLRAGSRKNELRPPWPLEKQLPEPLPQLRGARDAARLLRLAAQEAASGGDLAEAIEICLAQLQVGSDLLRGPTLIFALFGHLHLATAAVQMEEHIDQLGEPEAARVLRFLERLDSQLPAFSECLASEVLSGVAGLREQQAGLGFRERAVLFWNSTSSALVQFECSARYEEILQGIRGRETGTWMDAQRGYRAPDPAGRGLGTIVVDLVLPALRLSESAHRASRTRLRLLRAHLLIRSGLAPGADGWPTDPFDLNPLRWREVDGTIEISSVWKDGVPSPGGDWLDPDRSEGDCVLRVPPRPNPR